MLIEEFIRLGRPLLEGGFDSTEVLGLVADVSDPRVRNFYRNIYVVELAANESTPPRVLPHKVWGSLGERDRFDVDIVRAAGAPIALPGGGNPIHPQGRYPLPAYPVYGAHFEWFRDSPAGVERFLRGRLERTPQMQLSEPELNAIAQQLHEQVLKDGANEDWLGVLVLARLGGLYSWVTVQPGLSDTMRALHTSDDGQLALVPDADLILAGVWAARLEEAANEGNGEGVCFNTGQSGRVVAPYCTVWPWAFLTWTCPLPHGGSTALLTEGVGLSESAYRALVLGACIFRRLTKLVRPWVLHEVFAPVGDRVGRNIASKRSLNDLAPIYGTAFILPVQDRTLADHAYAAEFANGVLSQLRIRRSKEPNVVLHLESIAGFDLLLPEELGSDDFRLTLVYFSGDVSRGDVHLRAFIQDVLPSVARALDTLARASAQQGKKLLLAINPKASADQTNYLVRNYLSVPYLLARAYGGPHLWTQLEAAMHRRRLEPSRIIANAAARLASLVPNWPDSRFDVNDEVIFYLTALVFVADHNTKVAQLAGNDMPMRPWPELLDLIEREPILEMHLRTDDPAELGFACGVLTRQFAKWYWHATKVSDKGKDYLEHRVLTFGSDLSPAQVRNGLRLALELPKRLRDLRLSAKFEQRVGCVLCEFDNRPEQLRAHRDSFLAAFWAGYALQGANAPVTPDQPLTVSTEDQQ